MGKEKNWLFALAGIALCFALIFDVWIENELPYKGKRNFSNLPFGITIIVALVWAPIVEEIIFRGFFVNRKWIKITALISLPLFILFGFANYLTIFLLILFFILISLNIKYVENVILQNLSILLNILLFTTIHYDFEELITLEYFYLPFYQFSLGCILVWTAINFNLLKAILLHFSWNVLIVAILLYNLQFPNKETKVFKNEFIRVEWSRTSIFNDDKSILMFSKSSKSNNDTVTDSEGYLEARNVEAKNVYQIVSDSLIKNKEIFQIEPFMKYNFLISSEKQGIQEKSLEENISTFLREEDLIYLIKE
ncbi:CPBP family intramembrane metalloprotease [Salegentibacter sp. LM13S]|uniref:CPBP family intramembrane glutamic endopeptidase n=1 Tax=Salegentibacter lacus TaxID=2873599 RepID=UPI001CC912B2|nr:CPBP family intramembrane glutamic endopeptidase [Salegentibacter lacus]MBZ9630578.1 CPBP family intramembrane metalloprotease [Salegentibacter lacus]